MRGTSESTWLRDSRTARLTGAGIAVLLAAAGVTAYLITSSHNDVQLPTRVVSTQAIGLVNPGPAAADPANTPSGTAAAGGTLVAAGSGLTFSTDTQAGAEWTADQMAGGTYIFIYLANSALCLAAPATPGPATAGPALLQRCDLAANQRWSRQGLTVGTGGTDYWQLRSLADSQCLTAGEVSGEAVQLEPCQDPAGHSQLVTFAEPS